MQPKKGRRPPLQGVQSGNVSNKRASQQETRHNPFLQRTRIEEPSPGRRVFEGGGEVRGKPGGLPKESPP